MNSSLAGDVPVTALLAVWSVGHFPVPADALHGLVAQRGGHCFSRGGSSVWIRARLPRTEAVAASRFILGDAGSLGATDHDRPSASAASVSFGLGPDALVAITSITGLPPLFLAVGQHLRAIASDVSLLRGIPGLELVFDEGAVADVARFGHPTNGRTLFRGVTHIEAGARLHVDDRGGHEVRRIWQMPERRPQALPAFIEAQAAAFNAAVARLPTDATFLSLTAGLDTRAIFSALVSSGRTIPAATITGPKSSIDARIAKRLSRDAGLEFVPIVLDDEWERALPSLVERASLLSGGLEGFGQAADVYMYDRLGARFATRCSGNLGNQVGRGGTEGVSTKQVDPSVFSPTMAHASTPQDYWLLGEMQGGTRDRLEILIQREVPYTLAANAGVGYHHALQVTPYADRGLIETLALRPLEDALAPQASALAMRFKDLRHRFLGEPTARSFQRTLVRRAGGAAAKTPVNWGWRPSGGMSLSAATLGVLSAVGAAGRAGYLRPAWINGTLAHSRLAALHSFRDSHRWLTGPLAPFIRDTLMSANDLPEFLAPRGVAAVAERFFAGERQLQSTVVFALDLTLAKRHFLTAAPRSAP